MSKAALDAVKKKFGSEILDDRTVLPMAGAHISRLGARAGR